MSSLLPPKRKPWIVGLCLLGLAIPAVSLAVSSKVLRTVYGQSPGDWFGYSTTVANLDEDNFPDYVHGAFRYPAGTESGHVRVVFRTEGGVSVVNLYGENAGDWFGISVASIGGINDIGDFNGDELGDIVVGASGYDSFHGRTYVYYGQPGGVLASGPVLEGEDPGDEFGFTVAGAGDVNGDGFGDIIVGARSHPSGSGTGRAYIFYGGFTPDALPDLVMDGGANFDEFGTSVASAGDVNGDGFGDWIVGSSRAGGPATGLAFVFFGGDPPDNSPDLTLRGENADDRFGTSVASAGDFNGDGFDDLIVGATDHGSVAVQAGRAYLFFGGAAPDPEPDLIFDGEEAGDALGQRVASAGDVNADGFGDVILGSIAIDAGAIDNGRAYVYLGGPFGDDVPDLVVTGSNSGDWLGAWVGSAGDNDFDGFDDLLIGASGGGPNGEGAVHIIGVYPNRLLSPNGGETWVAGSPVEIRWRGEDLVDIGLSADGGASWSVLASAVGGMPFNAYSLTAPSVVTDYAKIRILNVIDTGADESDGVFQIVLPIEPPPVAPRLQVVFRGETDGDIFGNGLAPAGDLNLDGYPDFVAGAPFHDGVGTHVGRAYVYFGGPNVGDGPGLVIDGLVTRSNFGFAVGGGGDLNGDGAGDFFVSAPAIFDGSLHGAVYVYYGGALLDSTPDLVLTGSQNEDEFGLAVSIVGNINGDAFDDIVVGAPFFEIGGNYHGRCYAYFGSASSDPNPDLFMTGEEPDAFFGSAVSGAGDVNADGFGDFVIGNNNGAAGGQAFVFHGGLTPDPAPDLILQGEYPGGHFGEALASGDVNGDGRDDILVGAYLAGDGEVYVYFGGPSMDTVPDVILIGEGGNTSTTFGRSVAALDVNRDGFDDIAVGDNAQELPESSTGRAYVFYGGPGVDGIADFAFNGEAMFDNFGGEVASAGDVNGDGFPDLLVAGHEAGVGNARGKVRLYDFNRYHLISPNGGEIWNVGATETVSWSGAAPADVRLSTDGGQTYQILEHELGGAAENSVPLLVPHTPGRFSRIQVVPHDPALSGSDASDSLFTIEASIALLGLKAETRPEGGVVLSWETDPGLEDLKGYRVERRRAAGEPWGTLAQLIRETVYVDDTGGPGMRYRLFCVNGLSGELLLGEISVALPAPLTAWPLPYRDGTLHVSFVAGSGAIDVSVFDTGGRLVRRLTGGPFDPGPQRVTWDGRDELGRRVVSGVYFLRAVSGDRRNELKVVVIR